MKFKILLLVFVVFLYSCEKEQDVTYSGTYESKEMKIMPIRMFTNGTEVTDYNKILEFVENMGNQQIFITNYDSIVNVENRVRVEFLSGNKSIFQYIEDTDERNVVAKGDKIYFELDEILTQYNQTTNPFWAKVIMHFPLYAITSTMPTSSGFVSKTEYKHCYYANSIEPYIEFPLLNYYYKHNYDDVIISVEAQWNLNNEFNSNAINELTLNDTLVVQEFKIVLKK
ncbi:MAG TPA: hypothetical protein PLH91_05365 [Tenuifilaceae bacterium]|nr:hypothetical protein [Tenuifilaceae bacterium]HPI44638.1 hypothetical protein [Tenuifilaceae bacterium]HPN21993.1 hypothetical protein [Tenuifilaceae bacterium]